MKLRYVLPILSLFLLVGGLKAGAVLPRKLELATFPKGEWTEEKGVDRVAKIPVLQEFGRKELTWQEDRSYSENLAWTAPVYLHYLLGEANKNPGDCRLLMEMATNVERHAQEVLGAEHGIVAVVGQFKIEIESKCASGAAAPEARRLPRPGERAAAAEAPARVPSRLAAPSRGEAPELTVVEAIDMMVPFVEIAIQAA